MTASARSRLGQRITFAVHDETHSWLEHNGGWALADTQRRNLAGMKGRSLETTNAWDPSERSVAQLTDAAAAKDVYRDRVVPPTGNVRSKRDLRRMLKAVYGDSWWVDVARIEAEFFDIAEHDEVQARRFFLNEVVPTSGAWMDGEAWDRRAKPRAVADGTQVVLGFDGSRYDDWTFIRAETADGYQFTPTFARDSKPTYWDPLLHGGEVPEAEVQAAVHELFHRFDVVLLYADPAWWQSQIDGWAVEYPERVMAWDTRRDKQMSDATERLHTDVMTGAVTHDGCQVTAVHVRNARKQRRRGGTVITKDRPGSPNKIDGAVTSIITHEARSDALTLARFGGRKKKTALATFVSY